MLKLPERHANTSVAKMVSAEPLKAGRTETIASLESTHFDVVVIGGGITGAYTAMDASLRGLRVALLEKGDFASGTSSKSSKMIHGGLRYIEQGNLPLVRHSLLERQRLRRNAPHLVQRLPFMFPVLSQGGAIDPRLAKGFEALLWTYDLAGGWREGILHKSLSKNEVIARCPTLKPEMIKKGLLYYDARADDARLTLAIARTAAFHGAKILNYAHVNDVLRQHGKVNGVRATVDGREITVQASSVVVATGAWLRDWTGAGEGVETPNIRPAKGVHVALPWSKIRNDCTVTIPVPGRTRRATLTRWGDISLLGTTDEDYSGPLDDVNCTREELDFLLEGARVALNVDITADDVLGSIAGCRPLLAPPGGKTMEVKRNHEIRVDADGLITVVGGKLTTSRHMAEQTVDATMKVLDRKGRCRTKSAYILGGAGYDASSSEATGGLAAHLSGRYGMEAMHVSDILAENPDLARPIVPGHPYIEAEIVYSARHEMAHTVDDILSRRTRLRLYARDASSEAAPRVGEILREHLGLSQEETAEQVRQYQDSVSHEKSILMGEGK